MINGRLSVKKGPIPVGLAGKRLKRDIVPRFHFDMMLQRSKGRLITILTHVLIWSVFALAIFLYRPILSTSDIPYQFWIRQTVTLGLLLIAFYINASLLVPQFLLKNRLTLYFAAIAVIIAAVVLVHAGADSALEPSRADQVFSSRPMRPPRLDHGTHLEPLMFVITALVLGIGTSITAIQKWQRDKQRREELEGEKLSSELSFLRAQVNPHFFFNTLNNIYALTEVDGKLAGKAIHQLSRMMRYLLYETQAGHTMLSQEVAFVKDYISLTQLRLAEDVRVRVDFPPNLKDLPLAPMIFLPFVENAFKHGVRSTHPSHIDIALVQRNQVVDLTVKNSVIRDNSVSLDNGSGIGLANTRRRLDLLYPGKYKLDIDELTAANEFTVHLVLDLS